MGKGRARRRRMHRKASAGVICLPPPRPDPTFSKPVRAIPLEARAELLVKRSSGRTRPTFAGKVAKGLRVLHEDAIARWAASVPIARPSEQFDTVPRSRALAIADKGRLSRLVDWLAIRVRQKRKPAAVADADQLMKLRRDLDTMRRRIDRMLEAGAI